MKWKTLWVIAGCIIGILQSANAQTEGIIRGRVNDQQTNEAIPFANVVLQGSTVGTTTDFDGNFELREVPPGLRNIQVSFLGYESKTVFEIEVTPARPAVCECCFEAFGDRDRRGGSCRLASAQCCGSAAECSQFGHQ